MRHNADTAEALKLVDRLLKMKPSRGLALHASRMRQRLNAVPMRKVIAKMEGGSVSAKARTLGVTRQTIYYWLNEVTRPNEEQAKKISKLTGFSVAEIRALGDA